MIDWWSKYCKLFIQYRYCICLIVEYKTPTEYSITVLSLNSHTVLEVNLLYCTCTHNHVFIILSYSTVLYRTVVHRLKINHLEYLHCTTGTYSTVPVRTRVFHNLMSMNSIQFNELQVFHTPCMYSTVQYSTGTQGYGTVLHLPVQ